MSDYDNFTETKKLWDQSFDSFKEYWEKSKGSNEDWFRQEYTPEWNPWKANDESIKHNRFGQIKYTRLCVECRAHEESWDDCEFCSQRFVAERLHSRPVVKNRLNSETWVDMPGHLCDQGKQCLNLLLCAIIK
jgi:hypothetical protein